MDVRDLQTYAMDALAELVSYECKGFMDSDDVISTIEGLESDFNGDSYCPYYSQQGEVISRYEREFGQDAEDICGDQEYKAADWQQAQTAYAYAIAYTGFNHYFETAKTELVEAVEEFVSDMQTELDTDCDRIELSMTCTLGWAAHDRELSDGTMIFESGQLDGCNGIARQVNGTWISSVIDPTPKSEETTEEAGK